ncbi:hypothetical protein AX17_004677 [Amanita inopinata Kibby_2008]|nr:hypothetical protein AX17_004677 [Amanita inopinata Kibby_2008]
MEADIPLKLRQDIEELWNSPTSPIDKLVTSLLDAIGCKITPLIDWTQLWKDLQESFPNKSTFVPAILRITSAWYERLLWRIRQKAFESWKEQFLRMAISGLATSIPLRIEAPSVVARDRPYSEWNAGERHFCIHIPKRDPVSEMILISGFDEDFDKCILESRRSMAIPAPAERISSISFEADDLEEHRSSESLTSAGVHNIDQPQLETLPSVDSLPPPSELFQQLPSHFLTLRYLGPGIRVQCSHEPSLRLLWAFLNKWFKGSVPGQEPEVLLQNSILSLGVTESLYIRHGSSPVDPVMILSFVEGVLKFKHVQTIGQGSSSDWIFVRRTI